MGVDGLQGPQLSSCDEPADSPPNTPGGLAFHSPGSPMEHMSMLVSTVTSVDMVHLKHVILFVDITSLNDAVTSYVMSQHCMCVGHMTIYYKRATNTWVGGSCL